MSTISEKIKADLKRLSGQGVSLFNAMQVEQYPDRMEAHFKNNLKKDYEAFKNTLPSFIHAYQAWYSEALVLIRQFLPDRATDFSSLYEASKTRKEIKPENYVIEDYLKDIQITAGYEKKIIAGPSDAIAVFQQQLNILNSVNARLDSSLFDIQRLLQSELLDAELQTARLLAKNQFLRSAGAVAGIVLEKHLEQVRVSRQLKIGKKNPTISDYNDLFKKHEVYDFPQWRFIQYLGQIRDLCCKDKKNVPTADDLYELTEGVEKVIKTIF